MSGVKRVVTIPWNPDKAPIKQIPCRILHSPSKTIKNGYIQETSRTTAYVPSWTVV